MQRPWITLEYTVVYIVLADYQFYDPTGAPPLEAFSCVVLLVLAQQGGCTILITEYVPLYSYLEESRQVSCPVLD